MAVFKSTNDGVSWDRKNLDADTGQVSSLKIQPGTSNVILAGGFTMDASYTRKCRMYRSTDAGSSWTRVGQATWPTTYDYITAIAWDRTVANRVLAGSSSNLYVSTDAGATWSLLKSSMSSYDLIADPGRANTFYIGGYSGVSVSTNGGSTWTAMNAGLATANVWHLALDATNRRLYAATSGDGIYRYDNLTDVPEEPASENVPARFALLQNYPNPFNPVTTIHFDVPESGPYRLAVYDMLGRQVAVLVDGRVEAGHNTVTFDAGGLASGGYVYQLRGTPGILTRKMALIK